MRKSLLLFLLLFGMAFSASAQTTVSGTVKDEGGEMLPGATVTVKGTSTGTVTDIDGKYSLQVANGEAVLVYSFVGYTNKEVTVGAQTIIDVVLTNANVLEEVIVTAFGVEVDKKALTSSVQSVKGQAIADASTPNAMNALQGKVAGVQIRSSSGMPGASNNFIIRGNSSLTGSNQPLFIVDGTPINSTSSSTNGVSGTDASSRSLDLNPEDIKDISVLKGAAAAALYGVRAANGVVLITTKKGQGMKEGQVSVDFSQSFFSDKVSLLPDLQSTYSQGSGGRYNAGASTSWGPRITDMADPSVNGSSNGDGTYTNNVGEIVTPQVYDNVTPMFETGLTSISNIAVTGGTKMGNYSIGLGYTDQSGIIPTTGMNRINTKFAGDFKLSSKLKSSISINYVNTTINKLAGGSNLSNVLFTTYWAPRSYDLWGTPFAVAGDPARQIHYRGAMDNPRWSLANNSFNEKTERVFGNFRAFS